MTRREAVRIVLFAPGVLSGRDRRVRCALTNVSAAGALLSFTGATPEAPLRLQFELDGETLAFEVEVVREPPEGGLAVAFPPSHADHLHHLIAAEQRRALAQGRSNISERRLPPAFQGQTAAREPRAPGAGEGLHSVRDHPAQR